MSGYGRTRHWANIVHEILPGNWNWVAPIRLGRWTCWCRRYDAPCIWNGDGDPDTSLITDLLSISQSICSLMILRFGMKSGLRISTSSIVSCAKLTLFLVFKIWISSVSKVYTFKHFKTHLDNSLLDTVLSESNDALVLFFCVRLQGELQPSDQIYFSSLLRLSVFHQMEIVIDEEFGRISEVTHCYITARHVAVKNLRTHLRVGDQRLKSKKWNKL